MEEVRDCSTMMGALILVVICFIVEANSVDNVYSDNGWRPMSNEKVNELRRNFIKTPANLHFPTQRNFPKSPDNLLERGYAVTIIPKANKNTVDEDTMNNSERRENMKLLHYSEDYENWSKPLITANILPKLGRKAKKIMDRELITSINNVFIPENDIDKEQRRDAGYDEVKKENNTQPSKPSHIYEVKENTETDLIASDQYHKEYFYEAPKVKTFKNNNLTSNLFNILANYNIRTSDKLPNYALSLRQNSRNSDTHDFVYMQIPIKIPLRHNNGNHLPLDPLLALFLSNYGHYIPGLYGFPGGFKGFNNLYGNLAYNNIHNNKPFGGYKIYSDTDSLN